MPLSIGLVLKTVTAPITEFADSHVHYNCRTGIKVRQSDLDW